MTCCKNQGQKKEFFYWASWWFIGNVGMSLQAAWQPKCVDGQGNIQWHFWLYWWCTKHVCAFSDKSTEHSNLCHIITSARMSEAPQLTLFTLNMRSSVSHRKRLKPWYIPINFPSPVFSTRVSASQLHSHSLFSVWQIDPVIGCIGITGVLHWQIPTTLMPALERKVFCGITFPKHFHIFIG